MAVMNIPPERLIPLDTLKIKDSNGKTIAAYQFGDWEAVKKTNQFIKSIRANPDYRKIKKCIN